ncbi:ATP-binding cassette domain-containing protein, partial [bacterium]
MRLARGLGHLDLYLRNPRSLVPKTPTAQRALPYNAPVLRACGLTKRYGDRLAVDGVSLEVPKGSFYGLLGPNGAGKTTTLSMLVGFLKPDAGQVEMEGAVGTTAMKRRIGYVPQELALYDDLSA